MISQRIAAGHRPNAEVEQELRTRHPRSEVNPPPAVQVPHLRHLGPFGSPDNAEPAQTRVRNREVFIAPFSPPVELPAYTFEPQRHAHWFNTYTLRRMYGTGIARLSGAHARYGNPAVHIQGHGGMVPPRQSRLGERRPAPSYGSTTEVVTSGH